MIEVAASTLTNKSENQDWFSKITNASLQLHGVVVTDGLGSFSHAKEASRIVAKFISTSIEELKDVSQIKFEDIFFQAKKILIEYANENGILAEENTLGTTAIVLVHYPMPDREYNTIKIAYVGNGGIFHIRGNFNHFNESQLIPWNALNYLNPHSIQEDGKEALYKLISASKNYDEAVPTILTIRTDPKFGDIFMICTDGVYSFDQVQVGKDNQSRIWVSAEKATSLFYEELNEYFKSDNSIDLEQHLSNYLDKLNKIEPLDDDATIGVLVTEAAIKYQKTKNNADNNSKQIL
jgi:PPM family protein phosphatase